MKKQIKKYSKKFGIEYCGFTEVDNKSAIVFLFPYFSEYDENSNISIYTYGKDYHIVIKDILENICNFVKEKLPEFEYEIYADISPYNDIELAYHAGLGVIGKNHLLINEKYGSFVFIGYIITTTKFEYDYPDKTSCLNCNKCIKVCPSKTLSTGDFTKCLSSVTQKKGDLTDSEVNLISKNKYAFGCDLCQLVCPMNKRIKTSIKEFKENLTTKIKKDDFKNLSNREFKNIYGKKAFSWRGKNILIRNLSLLENESENPQE